jgi:uncharacterized membrane protein YhaH (DUF805 family)
MDTTKLRLQAIGLLIGYGLQFLAGMSLNLFVTIPSTHPGSTGSNYFSRSLHSLDWILSDKGGWGLAFHVYLGLLLVLGSISLCIKALHQHDKNWALAGGIAALLTIGAFFNGLSFVDFNKNISSMIMAICWLGTVGALIAGLVKFQGQPLKSPLKHKRN